MSVLFNYFGPPPSTAGNNEPVAIVDNTVAIAAGVTVGGVVLLAVGFVILIYASPAVRHAVGFKSWKVTGNTRARLAAMSLNANPKDTTTATATPNTSNDDTKGEADSNRKTVWLRASTPSQV